MAGQPHWAVNALCAAHGMGRRVENMQIKQTFCHLALSWYSGGGLGGGFLISLPCHCRTSGAVNGRQGDCMGRFFAPHDRVIAGERGAIRPMRLPPAPRPPSRLNLNGPTWSGDQYYCRAKISTSAPTAALSWRLSSNAQCGSFSRRVAAGPSMIGRIFPRHASACPWADKDWVCSTIT